MEKIAPAPLRARNESACIGEGSWGNVPSMKPLNWGILATGKIASAFAEGVKTAQFGRLGAVASRDEARAKAFSEKHEIPVFHGSYEALFANSAIDAVYIATPHTSHATLAIQAAEAGKQVLCEKPVGLNRAEAMAVAEAARESGVTIMEAYMYRCHPQTAALVRLLRDGAIGPVRLVQATFGFRAPFSRESRLFDLRLGGGGILDVGGYPASMARLIAGSAAPEGPVAFANPTSVKAHGRLHPETGVDTWAAATAAFESGLLAQLSTSVGLAQQNDVRIYGESGWIRVPNPWMPARLGGEWAFELHRDGKEETIRGDEPRDLYGVEADHFAALAAGETPEAPGMPLEDTVGNMETLDVWRREIGLAYPSEELAYDIPPVKGRPPKPRPGHNMRYGEVPGLEKKPSKFFMGVDNQRELPHAAVMFDDFVERGGNAFDTAYIYGGGHMEKVLGSWMRARRNRDDLVVIAKGGHTPHNNPQAVRPQLETSLERLQTDYADIYLLHRDNPDIPAGEFVDVLDGLKREGLIRVFGGSNWTAARVREANDYAAANGKQGFSVLSNNLSLARMVDPVWKGCVSASDPETRAFLAETGIASLSWSSQARGFFTERAAPDKRDDPELVRCWYSEDNFERKRRAEELARERGVLPINIAAAYVLRQPFPSFCLFGPRQLSETRTSLPALDVELTPDELAWLNLERKSR